MKIKLSWKIFLFQYFLKKAFYSILFSFFLQNEMVTYFEAGQGTEFFQMWTEYLPENIRNQDTVAQKLEFYLNIYFAIYPIKHGTGVSFDCQHHTSTKCLLNML